MKKNLLTGTLAAVFVLSLLAAASANEHHAAVEAPVVNNAVDQGPHVRVWKKLTKAEDTAEKQVHLQAAPVKEPEAVKAPEKVAHAKVLKKTETAAAKQEAQKLKELQAKLTQAEASVKALQKKLSLAEQHAQDTKKLQAKLARAESSIQMLEKKNSRPGKHGQGMKELQQKLVKAESIIKQLQQKLAQAGQNDKGTKELQTKFAKAESTVRQLQQKLVQAEQHARGSQKLQAKLVQAESVIKQLRANCADVKLKTQETEELQAKLAQAESAVRDLSAKLEQSALSIRNLRDQAAAVKAEIPSGCESLQAQIIGLGRIIGEKDAALNKINKERDHWKINKNILLSKITEQRAGLEKLQEENNALLRDFAAKEKECAE